MTRFDTRATLAAFLLAASPLALCLAAHAQDVPSQSDIDRATRASGNKPKEVAQPANAGPALTPDVGKNLQAAQKAVGTKDWKGALDASLAAKAAAKSDYDTLKVNQFLTVIYNNMGDSANAAVAAEAAADVPAIPDTDKQLIYTNATVLALNAGHTAKAVTYAKQLEALNLTDARSQDIIGKALYNGGDYADAQTYVQKEIDAQVAAGKKPERTLYEMVMNAQIKAKDEVGAEKTLEALVINYGDPNDWQQLIDIAMTDPKVRDVDILYMGRLLIATGVPVSKQNADMFGATASHLTFYGDAQTAQSKGGTGFTVDAKKIADDKASMAQQIKLGASQNGNYNTKVAEALYSYGMYPEAEAQARLAQSKGGAPNADEPGMVIAMSLAAQGKYADATTAFSQVQGGGPATARIVRLWTIYAKNKANPPAAAAPAATAAAK